MIISDYQPVKLTSKIYLSACEINLEDDIIRNVEPERIITRLQGEANYNLVSIKATLKYLKEYLKKEILRKIYLPFLRPKEEYTSTGKPPLLKKKKRTRLQEISYDGTRCRERRGRGRVLKLTTLEETKPPRWCYGRQVLLSPGRTTKTVGPQTGTWEGKVSGRERGNVSSATKYWEGGAG